MLEHELDRVSQATLRERVGSVTVQAVGGDFCAGHVLGTTYALHSVDVVGGALLAENAGAALDEIEHSLDALALLFLHLFFILFIGQHRT